MSRTNKKESQSRTAADLSSFNICSLGRLHVCLIYLWGLGVLAILCYICSEVSEIHRLLRITVDRDLAGHSLPQENIAKRLQDSVSQLFSKIVDNSSGTQMETTGFRAGLDEL